MAVPHDLARWIDQCGVRNAADAEERLELAAFVVGVAVLHAGGRNESFSVLLAFIGHAENGQPLVPELLMEIVQVRDGRLARASPVR
jgi:hypothetical protein